MYIVSGPTREELFAIVQEARDVYVPVDGQQDLAEAFFRQELRDGITELGGLVKKISEMSSDEIKFELEELRSCMKELKLLSGRIERLLGFGEVERVKN